MTTSPSIIVRELSKRFRRETRATGRRGIFGRFARRRERDCDNGWFWAVRDVSFQVEPGEALGIIGANGAGKSTLLRLLAGILRAEQGTVETRGRVSTLIELGAGFHPDLTGRENIYLNASILGLRRREIQNVFDSVVEFAGIGEFLDMPVKRYSTGMHARLGFAVAAHVRPRVLLVDEVLSVGDRMFRDRCLARMREFLRDGVAVVFVSHDLTVVSRFCHRAIVLRSGGVAYNGAAVNAVAEYARGEPAAIRGNHAAGTELFPPVSVRILNSAGETEHCFQAGATAYVEFVGLAPEGAATRSLSCMIARAKDGLIIHQTAIQPTSRQTESSARDSRLRQRLVIDLNLLPGEYRIWAANEGEDCATSAERAESIFILGAPNAGGVAHLNPAARIVSDPIRELSAAR